MVEDTIYRLLSLPLTLASFASPYNESFEDLLMLENEKIMSYSVSLVGEIDDLINKGYTKEEIKDLIIKCEFTKNDPQLTNEEGEYLRRYSLKLLNIRYDLYLEEKESNNYTKKLKKEF